MLAGVAVTAVITGALFVGVPPASVATSDAVSARLYTWASSSFPANQFARPS